MLIIIPAYNEEKNIGAVLDQLAAPEIAGIADKIDTINALFISTQGDKKK